jgi:large subunit ribosomal protein L17
MRHKKKGRALNRTRSHRKWLLSNLVTSLFVHERIRTTTAKAKEARPLAEKMITFAKRGDLHARRQVLRFIRDKEAVSKLFETLGERFKDRPGGYTRILKIGNRLGDNAPMAFLELIPEEETRKSGGRKRRRRGKKKAAEPEKAAPQEIAPEASPAEDQAEKAAPEAEEQAAQAAEESPAEDAEETPAEAEEKGGEEGKQEEKKSE